MNVQLLDISNLAFLSAVDGRRETRRPRAPTTTTSASASHFFGTLA
jgi:hypothetical protein